MSKALISKASDLDLGDLVQLLIALYDPGLPWEAWNKMQLAQPFLLSALTQRLTAVQGSIDMASLTELLRRFKRARGLASSTSPSDKTKADAEARGEAPSGPSGYLDHLDDAVPFSQLEGDAIKAVEAVLARPKRSATGVEPAGSSVDRPFHWGVSGMYCRYTILRQRYAQGRLESQSLSDEARAAQLERSVKVLEAYVSGGGNLPWVLTCMAENIGLCLQPDSRI